MLFLIYLYAAELGSGVFGTCHKMLLSSTEVAVKSFFPNNSNRERVLFEASVMSKVCSGHPNLPLFLGVYDDPKDGSLPKLVSSLYSVKNRSVTLHMLLTGKVELGPYNEKEWARILLGICNGVEAVHACGVLHNDIKADNIVLSDKIPFYPNSPPLVPILVDLGKSRLLAQAKRYNLTDEERSYYRIHHKHIAPELINGTHSQSFRSDVYSLGRIVLQCSKIVSSSQLRRISQVCMVINPSFRPLPIGVHCRVSDIVQ